MFFPKTIEREVPLSEAARRGEGGPSPSNYPMWILAPAIESQQEMIEQLQKECAVEAACALLMGDLAALADPSWDQRHRTLEASYERLHRLQTEPWRRWANGFSCLFFVMVGAPLAIRMRNPDIWTTFAAVFLPILLVYYPLLAYGVDRAKVGDAPPGTVWVGNLLLAVWSLWILRKVIRY
jgi:lipopolysaccharide export system permease protein